MAHHPEQDHNVVFIASDAVLSAWRGRAASNDQVVEVRSAAEVDLLDLIAQHQPGILVLEEEFACSERGTMLIGRLRTSNAFQDVDIRVLWSERVAESDRQGATTPFTTIATSIRPSYPAVRRTARRRAVSVDASLDGQRVVIVDLSIGGAQVVSGISLNTDQRVQMVLADSIRLEGRVAWVKLEMSPAPRYRAGIEFLSGDTAALATLIPPG